MKKRLLLITLLLSLVSVVQADLSEEEYGEDLTKIQEQAEVDWLRDNYGKIYDPYRQSNTYVEDLSDRQIAYIMDHPRAWDMYGLNKSDLIPYVNGTPLMKYYVNETLGENKTKKELGLLRLESRELERVNCLKSQPSIYNPLRLGFSWTLNVSEEWLRVLVAHTGIMKHC